VISRDKGQKTQSCSSRHTETERHHQSQQHPHVPFYHQTTTNRPPTIMTDPVRDDSTTSRLVSAPSSPRLDGEFFSNRWTMRWQSIRSPPTLAAALLDHLRSHCPYQLLSCQIIPEAHLSLLNRKNADRNADSMLPGQVIADICFVSSFNPSPVTYSPLSSNWSFLSDFPTETPCL